MTRAIAYGLLVRGGRLLVLMAVAGRQVALAPDDLPVPEGWVFVTAAVVLTVAAPRSTPSARDAHRGAVRSRAVPTLADTTIRLLGQEPLAGPDADRRAAPRSPRSSTAPGFAYLEVSGGGCFDWAVKRGVESPWERIRALKARVEDAARRSRSAAASSSARGRSTPTSRAASSPPPPRTASTSSGCTTR